MITDRSPPARSGSAVLGPRRLRAKEGSLVSWIRTAVVLAAVLGLASCAVSPTGRDQLVMFSPSAMNEMGAAAFEEIKAETPAAGAYLERYVECVADALVAVLPGDQSQGWEVEVFDKDEPNAFRPAGEEDRRLQGPPRRGGSAGPACGGDRARDRTRARPARQRTHVEPVRGGHRTGGGGGHDEATGIVRGTTRHGVAGTRRAGGDPAALQPQPRERGGPDRAGAHGQGRIRPRGERGAVAEHVPGGRRPDRRSSCPRIRRTGRGSGRCRRRFRGR